MRDETADHQGHSKWITRGMRERADEAAEWTGEPMVERCETHDFFEKDKAYTRRDNQNRDARLDPQFLCKAVFTHDATRVLYAVGLYRSDANRPWNPYPVHLILKNWREKWTEIPVPKDENAE